MNKIIVSSFLYYVVYTCVILLISFLNSKIMRKGFKSGWGKEYCEILRYWNYKLRIMLCKIFKLEYTKDKPKHKKKRKKKKKVKIENGEEEVQQEQEEEQGEQEEEEEEEEEEQEEEEQESDSNKYYMTLKNEKKYRVDLQVFVNAFLVYNTPFIAVLGFYYGICKCMVSMRLGTKTLGSIQEVAKAFVSSTSSYWTLDVCCVVLMILTVLFGIHSLRITLDEVKSGALCGLVVFVVIGSPLSVFLKWIVNEYIEIFTISLCLAIYVIVTAIVHLIIGVKKDVTEEEKGEEGEEGEECISDEDLDDSKEDKECEDSEKSKDSEGSKSFFFMPDDLREREQEQEESGERSNDND